VAVASASDNAAANINILPRTFGRRTSAASHRTAEIGWSRTVKRFHLWFVVASLTASPFGAAAGASFAAPAIAPIAFVPLDDRPVTYQLPVMLGEIAGQPVVTPPRLLLGSYVQPGDPDGLGRWLRSDATQNVSALVASSDMVAYGGLVASRVPGVSLDEAVARLRDLAAIKSAHAVPFVGVFATIMRLAPTGVPALGAAAGYYATGATVDAIQAFANLPDPPATADDIRKAERLRALIGPSVLAAYLATRRRNRSVDQWALQLAAEGGYDRIVVGQDDAGPVGLHLKDVAALQRTARRFHLGDRASIEPGADELGMLMLARVFARNAGWQPTVGVTYSRPDGGAVVDHLEFTPIDATIGQIIGACGARRRASGADIELFVRVAGTSDIDEQAFEDAIAVAVAGGRSVAVADLSFLEGSPGSEQRRLTEALVARGIAGKIDAFASWNTDANTVGTALPEAIAAGAGRRAGTYDARAHAQFMLDRYVDDYAFHQFVRPALNDELRARSIDTSLLLPAVALDAAHDNRAALWPQALDLLARIYPQYRDAGLTITLPWDRTFETRIDVRLAAPAGTR
jgi:hypothetical protein